ncbi:MAG: NAD(P)-binding domain-containing protein [Paracoccaceae bacterium]
MKKMRFAVIGAGAGGLCAAKNLIARGIEPVIFEVGTRIGGLWAYENDSGRSPAYKSLRINSEARASSYGDFPFPEGTQYYPNTTEMETYFVDYARKFGLTEKIRFQSWVEAIAPEGEGYRVTIAGKGEEHFDGVIVASGHQCTPRHPEQVAGFDGHYIHANDYRVPAPYEGKRVLVIGPGNSGVDIAADICTVTEQTYLAARSPVLIMPRMMFGKPQSRTLGLLEKPWLPWRLKVWIRTQLTRVFHGRMEDWGFRTPKGRTHPISHPTLIFHLAWNRIMAKPGISRVEGKVVHFTDGTSEEMDAIIAATGYETDLPFLPEGTSPVQGTHMQLYNRIVHPDLPNVFFVGFFDVTGGSNIRMMDDQSEYAAAIAAGAIRLPTSDAMRGAIREDLAFQKAQFPDSPRYGLELDPMRYRKRLAEDFRRYGVAR